MPERHGDWLRQAHYDVDLARVAAREGHFEWAAFAAQQAAEKAAKALHLYLGNAAWGHDVTQLLTLLPVTHQATPQLLETARRLDRHYLPARYPNGFAAGTPRDHYSLGDAEQAIADAETIIDFCRGSIPG